MRSVLDEYLPGYARERGTGPRRVVSLDDMPEVLSRLQRAKRLPHGERGPAMRAIAQDFGITTRSLERYYYLSELVPVRVAGYRALFLVRPGIPPRQASNWEPA